ncbi:MAG: hypothetical protein ACYCY7_05500, partial [Gallionella sp.]
KPTRQSSNAVIARRRSRRGNPDGFKKMHLGLAGLLHFIRNDDKGVANYGSINSRMARSFISERRDIPQG